MEKPIYYYQELANEFNTITNDKERWLFIIDHTDELKVVLDNDQTQVCFITPKGIDEVNYQALTEIDINMFDNYIGCSDGIIELLGFIGIDCETV